jgi:hypothetical protein
MIYFVFSVVMAAIFVLSEESDVFKQIYRDIKNKKYS